MTNIRTQISPILVIARSLFSQVMINMLNDEAISLKRLTRYFKEIAASKEFLNRIVQNELLAMTSAGFVGALEFDTCNLGFNTK